VLQSEHKGKEKTDQMSNMEERMRWMVHEVEVRKKSAELEGRGRKVKKPNPRFSAYLLEYVSPEEISLLIFQIVNLLTRDVSPKSFQIKIFFPKL
jgi:hypothetical protein